MTKTSKRVCQPCTACCDGWVQMEINGVPVYPGNPCPHSTGRGCDAYDKRPKDPCDLFNCGWVVEDSPLPDWMKPSNSKVFIIFDKLVWNDLPVDLAVPVGKRIPPHTAACLEVATRIFQKTDAPSLVCGTNQGEWYISEATKHFRLWTTSLPARDYAVAAGG